MVTLTLVVASIGAASATITTGIAGTVTGEGTPLSGVEVEIKSVAGDPVTSVFTAADGSYEVAVPAGLYKVFFDPGALPYDPEWFENGVTFGDAADVNVVDGQVTVIDADLSGDIVRLEGAALDPVAAGIEGVCVTVFGSAVTEYTLTASDGTFSVQVPTGDGTFRVRYSTTEPCNGLGPGSPTDYVTEWWDDKPDITTATPIVTSSGATVSGLVAQMALLSDGLVTGRVTDENGAPIQGITVWRGGEFNGDPVLTTATTTDANGEYALVSPAGPILILFDDIADDYVDEWYDDSDFANATWIDVVASTVVSGVDAVLAGGPVVTPVDRLAGADRFATAAAISAEFAGPVDVVFVATGTNFPDALATVPASLGAPVLLTNRDVLPAATLNELIRLQPSLIVVVGGTGVISDAVANALASVAPVERVAGADRFATAVALSQRFFPGPGPHVAYVATGFSFPDALAGGPAAHLNPVIHGTAEGPMLLTNTGSLPGVTKAELQRLSPDTIYILGGTGAVSDTVEAELAAIAPVVRLSGPDRYWTATNIALETAPADVDVVYVATGLNFPDALAGGALAAIQNAPILLVDTNTIPVATQFGLTTLQPKKIVVLGGSGVVSDAVAQALAAYEVP